MDYLADVFATMILTRAPSSRRTFSSIRQSLTLRGRPDWRLNWPNAALSPTVTDPMGADPCGQTPSDARLVLSDPAVGALILQRSPAQRPDWQRLRTSRIPGEPSARFRRRTLTTSIRGIVRLSADVVRSRLRAFVGNATKAWETGAGLARPAETNTRVAPGSWD